MKSERIITSLYVTDPSQTAEFLVKHASMQTTLDIGWFISLTRADQPNFEIALTEAQHPSVPKTYRKPVAGVAIAIVVPSADDAYKSLEAANCEPINTPVDHPWGQRQFFAPGPDGLLLDLIEITRPDPQWLAENGISV